MPGNVVLIGFMGAGKTQVGRALARRLGREFVDTDDRLVARFGCSIADYFRAHGEPAFREAEAEEVAAACALTDRVLSLGGGAPVRPANLAAARDGNVVVWLRAPAEEIYRRLVADGTGPVRPMLAGDDPRARIRTLLEQREPVYAQAHLTIDTAGRSIEEVVDAVAAALPPEMAGARR